MGILNFLKREKEEEFPGFDESTSFDEPSPDTGIPAFPTPQPIPPPPVQQPVATAQFHDKNLEIIIGKLDVIKEKLEKIEQRIELIERYMYGSR